MNRSEIIELSNQLTERKGEKQLNMQTLFRLVVQDIAKRERFWWRRISVAFNLVAAQKTYDTTTFLPAETVLDEITKLTVILAPSPLQVAELVAVYDPQALIEMEFNTTQVSPARYTMSQNDFKTLLIDPPDRDYQAYIVGWGMPNPDSDSVTETVPLIPPWGHNTIVAGLNAKIFKFAYGSKNEKTLDAQMEYEMGINDLAARKQFDPNYRSQLTFSEDAVRST